MLPSPQQERPTDTHLGTGMTHDLVGLTSDDPKERKTLEQTEVLEKETQKTLQKHRFVAELAPETVNIGKMASQAVDNNVVSQRREKNVDRQDTTEKKPCRKPKKNIRGVKGSKKREKDKEKLATEPKVDFPEPLVKAHQAAYAFLNPNINKYDVVLGLLEQATQTQVSVQPMVAFLALRYEEIILCLEEMADEGEKVLKENGENLAWPSQMQNLSSSTPMKSGCANTEPPPDLLQQLLQYTTQRMRNVSQAVGGIGDSALEEAVEYFASVTELLEEKLKVKQAAETRLMQLLSRIEMASLRKPGPEDSALFSEDSGIGAESESLAGSERRHRRESSESNGTHSTTPVSPMGHYTRQGLARQRLARKLSLSLSSLNSFCSMSAMVANEQGDSMLGSVSLDDGEDDNDEEIDQKTEVKRVGFIKRSNSSPENHKQSPKRIPPRCIENPQNVEMTLKMKNAISGKIQFVASQSAMAKNKVTGSPQNTRRQLMDVEDRSSRRAVWKSQVKKPPVSMERRSRSADSIRSKGEDPTMLELEKTQKDLNQQLQKLNKTKGGKNTTRTALPKQSQVASPAQSPAITRKNALQDKKIKPIQPPKSKSSPKKSNNKAPPEKKNVTEDTTKEESIFQGPISMLPAPSPPSSPRPSSGLYRGRKSVKKLIDTFSQGIEGLDSSEVLGPLRGVRKCGVPVLPGLGNVEAVLSAGLSSCRSETSCSEKPEYLDVDSLPPPPLEVLMDNSFEMAQGLATGEADEGTSKVRRSPLLRRAIVSQRLRASIQSVPVLPSKGGLPQSSQCIVLAKSGQKDSSAQSKMSVSDVFPEVVQGEEKHTSYQIAKKTMHLERSLPRSIARTIPSTNHIEVAVTQVDEKVAVPGSNTTVPDFSATCLKPSGTTSVSRGRTLPSTPSTPSSIHQRLSSPFNFKRQPSPTSSASPPVSRQLPTPPSSHRRLPSPPVAKPNFKNSNSSTTFPLKAPSPPASPKVQRWSRESSSEDSSSVRTISNARSVFCPASSSLFEAQPCTLQQEPQTWAIPGGVRTPGRFPVSIQGPRPFIRRNYSDRRSSLVTSRSSSISVAESCGSEPALNLLGPDDEPPRDDELWGSQSDLRDTPRSASHPDLCVVGRALHRDYMGQ